MARAELLVDRLVATGFIRPGVLWRGLQCCRPSLARWRVSVLVGLSGLLVEPLAWLQSLLFARRLRRLQLPDDLIVVIGHWRSGTTYLHQLLACDPAVATARNTLTIAPQVALLLKPWIAPVLKTWMTRTRPIDAVPWGPDDPQEDELGLARLTFDTNMAGMAFPRNYLANFRRHVLVTTRAYERQWLQFCRLTWLHDGAGKTHWLIKNSVHTARVSLVLRHFPRARFVVLRRTPVDSIRSLVQVKQRLGTLVGLQPVPDQGTQVEETVTAQRELLEAFETSRHLIPDQQLLELDYDDLIHQPLQAVERIYTRFGLSSWAVAKAPIKARIDQARSYSADPVRLPQPAERRLQSLVKPT
jgi:hypothetical protein